MKLLLLCAFALVACAYARTATRTPAVTAHITSLTDKDARQKAMTHPAFANAGRQAGIEVWRIENFEPVPVAQKDFGKFYKGDSYIVLKTTSDKRNNLSWDIHYWIGSESSQDESGAAAILSVGLDDKFGGAAVQHRQPMGYESKQFTDLFPPGPRYVDGGVASGFNHVTTNAGAAKRMIQVKGKRNIRVRQVDPVISSLNKGDVFILDVDNDIYVFVGEKAKNVEKLKAISVANQIRDQDHSGRGRVEIIDQYSSEVDTQRFFTALGSGNRQLVPDESAGGDDQQFERSEEQAVVLSEVSDSSGKVKVTPLSKPYKQEQLKPQEAYILDTVSGSIYVWVGKQSTDKEKSEAMTKAQQYLAAKKYPSWVQVTRVIQGAEPAVFKQYFTTWRDAGMSHSRLVRSVNEPEDVFEPWTRHSRVPLYEVSLSANNLRFTYVPEGRQSALQSDEAYIVDLGQQVFVWLGSDAPEHVVKSATNIANAYVAHNRPTAVNLRTYVIKQGLEPTDFTQMFDEWDPDMWKKIKEYEADRERELRDNEIDVDK